MVATRKPSPSPANPTLSAAIQLDSVPIGSMTREFLEYVPHDISPHSPLVIVLHGALMDAKSMREGTDYEFDQMAVFNFLLHGSRYILRVAMPKFFISAIPYNQTG